MRTSNQPNRKCGDCINGYIHHTCSRVDTNEPHITTCEIENCNNLLTTNSSLIYCVEHLEKVKFGKTIKRRIKNLKKSLIKMFSNLKKNI